MEKTPREILRSAIELCADCDTCRFLMEEDCAFFPELYRLWDQETEAGVPIADAELRRLAELCTLCGLCSCPRIPMDVMEAKRRYVDKEGLPVTTRLLTDVPRLARLHAEGRLDTRFHHVPGRMVYFAPCHQREQKMGRPYLELLALIPGPTVERVGDTECCGMGGNFGFKADFHEQSLAVGRPLLEKIRKQDPEAIITDCLSCRLQFCHALPYPVFHPLEILARVAP
jgi:hypothetical protein